MSAAQYARLVSRKFRTPKLPKINRNMRPRVIAWAGPTAFYPNRFYEQDKWYKARIDKPELLPEMHIIDPTEHLRSLNEILASEREEPSNIGFAPRETKRTTKAMPDPELEKLSRTKNLRVDVDKSGEADWRVLRHSGIFQHLFGHNVFFLRTQDLSVVFSNHGMHSGNILWAEDTKNRPEVVIESVGANGFNTLIAVNLDGNAFEGHDGEILHWMVSNIPDGQHITAGEERATWMQALPFLGSGYHRLTFLLLRHTAKINVPQYSEGLENRIFSTARFYKERESVATPSCALFSHIVYDISVKEELHAQGFHSPIYEYQWAKPKKREQREFPHKPMPFDMYLDQYRDPKEIEAEIVAERLQKIGLKDVLPPRILDDNYVENKKTLEPWRHSKLLRKNEKNSPIYNNSLPF